jgi:hypothetical protein
MLAILQMLERFIVAYSDRASGLKPRTCFFDDLSKLDVPEGQPVPKAGEERKGSDGKVRKVTQVLTWQDRRERMREVCTSCHASGQITGFYQQFDNLVDLYNDKFAKPAAAIMAELYKANKLTPAQMDEKLEWTYCARPQSPRLCLICELHEHRAQRTGSGDALRERQPQPSSSSLQFEALGINADATPIAVGRTKQPRGIKPASVGMVRIHVRDRVSLGFDERLGVGNVSQYVLRLEIHNAAKASDKMRTSDLHPIECEIGEVHECFGVRVTPQIGGCR